MRWKGRRRSTQVEDRRGQGGAMAKGVGAVGGGTLLLFIVFTLLTGGDASDVVDVIGQTRAPVNRAPGPSSGGAPPAQQDEMSQFMSVVLADTEDAWTSLFNDMGRRYQMPQLVLFTDAVRSACGTNSAAVGPFYCPADSKVYIDLGFFNQLSQRFGAPGDFAQAYVLAHEVGHHVQNQLGISGQVQRARARASRAQANELSVRLELQADCLAGVWGNRAAQRQLLEPGDMEEGLRAAAAIGDDQMQRRAGGYVNPESWTHGSSEQRVEWFRRGLQTGSPGACDTFG